ncbi:2,3-bisphosphoglycerate-dependent phosphoglycerate mutase [Rhodococcus artemisiae]|uniref:2,3-bisphosphoglycerate-dependent phosphoglycerate mutase n=1 Tax=Rhodococcus artemisiae TaxID=714159 RepID=A0ABU7LA55_9NOCA|nr:2,3-bisphosphoglycerate-dependent phosphoglycerate mutase [Rhodococcus artemisiae]MEE2058434.1 2,3-bisphosphoglycerate-dependent phosphoglycerate mutase [Rhodococcus artemisiae]
MTEHHCLILLRHGESAWNAADRFAGWVDIPLTDVGRAEAHRSGELIRQAGALPDVVHTSLLRRAIRTADIALDAAGRHWIPVHRSWRLNERHYGDLQGQSREDVRTRFGNARVKIWRRSYDVAPPAIRPERVFSQNLDPRYHRSGIDVPPTESLRDVQIRLLPYWETAIVPDLTCGRTVLIVSHGNALRSLIMHLDRMTVDDIGEVAIPTGTPIRYDLDRTLRPVVPGGVVLEPRSEQSTDMQWESAPAR